MVKAYETCDHEAAFIFVSLEPDVLVRLVGLAIGNFACEDLRDRTGETTETLIRTIRSVGGRMRELTLRLQVASLCPWA